MKPDFPHGTPHPPFLDLKLNLNSEVARWSPLQALICAPNSKPNHAQPSFPQKLEAPPFTSFAQSRNAFLSGKKSQTPPRSAWLSPHLVHARVDEKQAGVAAGPHGRGWHQAVAMAVPKEAQEGVPHGRGLGWRGLG